MVLPTVKDTLLVSLLSITPKSLTSSAIGSLARSALSKPLVRYYVWSNGIDLDEAECSDVGAYATLGELFTRGLKPGLRPVDDSPGVAVVSPCDAEVAFVGSAADHAAALADGRRLDLRKLLRDRVGAPDDDVVVFYLSPRDYHRVHSPVDGAVADAAHVPGERWAVRPAFVRAIEGLFERNERVTMRFAGPLPLSATLVAAFGVGHMTWPDGAVVATGPSPHAGGVARGAHLATFGLGSTVILTAPRGAVDWDLAVGDRVKVGAKVATWRKAARAP